MKSRIAIVAVSLFMALSFSNGRADEFYKDKTIHFIVGAPAGGGYDTYTHAIARHLRKHIPGNPSMVVDNLQML